MEDDIPKWEYGTYNNYNKEFTVFQADETNKTMKNANLAKLGSEGWEGYAAVDGGIHAQIQMKRKKIRSSNSSYDYGR